MNRITHTIKRTASRSDHNDEATFNQNKTEIYFFSGFSRLQFLSILVASLFHCLSSFFCIVIGMKNRNILMLLAVHLFIARSRHFSVFHCFSILLLAIRLYFRFTMLQIIFRLEHASCLLSAFAFVRNIYHSETVCLYF